METVKEIPIKVYTFWNEKDKPEVRRFGLANNSIESFFLLSQKLLDVYPGLKEKTYIVSWKGNLFHTKLKCYFVFLLPYHGSTIELI